MNKNHDLIDCNQVILISNLPGWDRDVFSGISGIRYGTGRSLEKTGWDLDAPIDPGIQAIPELIP